jgi:rare lipoprotein A (peptidoglycan hydrolase)
MKKIYSKQVVILAIFSLVLFSGRDSNISQKNHKYKIVNTALAQEYNLENGLWYFYEVKENDTLKKIAKGNLITVDQLKEWNCLRSNYVLEEGMIIRIKRFSYDAYTGKASWYGPGFDGRKTASGLIFDQDEISVAHRTLPLGSIVRVTNLKNGKSIIAPVTDRGPYVKNSSGNYTREIDLSSAAAEYLETKSSGIAMVKIESINI